MLYTERSDGQDTAKHGQVAKLTAGSPASQIKRLVSTVLRFAGLQDPVRDGLQRLRAAGWWPWTSLVPEEDFSRCVSDAVRVLLETEPAEHFGDYAEFGVSRGTSLAIVDHVLREEGLPDVRLLGFDSFEGMPPEAEREGWIPGQFKSTLRATERYLRKRRVDLGRTTLVKGWFTETLTATTKRRLNLQKLSLIMIDCDIYSASKDALAFCAPHIHEQAVIMLDDWGWREDKGEIGQKEAFEEFLTDHPDLTAEPLPSYLAQSRVFLLRRAVRS